MKILIHQDDEHPHLFDPAEVLEHHKEDRFSKFDTKGKEQANYRNYIVDSRCHIQERVRRTYHQMHTNQTVAFVKEKQAKWLKFNHVEATIMEALDLLNEVVDEADPDLDMPNIVHAFQMAEKIRKDHPDKEWFQLAGLIHDLGKIMAFYNEPQWAVVGDTWVVGCKPQPSVVYHKTTFPDNTDMKDSKYNTLNGMYEAKCGLEKVLMSWGHDEYLYHVLKNHGTTLPDEALYAIRFHSFYPWHHGGDYKNLTNDRDEKMLPWVQMFSDYDLYTKTTTVPDIEKLKPYYQTLIDKYIPGNIKF